MEPDYDDDTDYGDPYIELEEANYYYDQDTEYGISDDPEDFEDDDVPGWVETDEPDFDEAFEIESSLGSIGWGTDEYYGYSEDPPF